MDVLESNQDNIPTPKRLRGRPKGTPGGGRYNTTTKPVRVPVELAPKIVKIIELYQTIENLKSDWEERIETAAQSSKNRKPSPRYDKAIQLLQELEDLL
ncbi:hypothetical protein [Anabaena azotica]|uniref:hypothetical protein n=1 Tax=Anabaena azotica TaxID=197653 RepID=UPI0039A62D7A